MYFNALIFPQNGLKIVKNQCIDFQIPHSGLCYLDNLLKNTVSDELLILLKHKKKTFGLFGLVDYSVSSSEDEDVTDDLSEVIANEHIQDKPIEIETNDEIITSESVHDKHDKAEKDDKIIKPVSHQIRMACHV